MPLNQPSSVARKQLTSLVNRGYEVLDTIQKDYNEKRAAKSFDQDQDNKQYEQLMNNWGSQVISQLRAIFPSDLEYNRFRNSPNVNVTVQHGTNARFAGLQNRFRDLINCLEGILRDDIRRYSEITNQSSDGVSKIFYSWQKDLPNSTNWGFIQKALESAAKTIRQDDTIEIEPVIDRDTVGVPGTPDIVDTILAKIDQAEVFVCDVSIINHGSQTRPTPNPNVLIELGYAMKKLGFEKILMVLNTAYGKVEDLPFDLRQRRVVTYHMAEETSDRATERRKVQRILEEALRGILTLRSSVEPQPKSEHMPELGERAKQLLVTAARDKNGTILFTSTMHGHSLVSNGKELVQSNTPREIALWQETLKELQGCGFIEPYGTKGQGFKVTGLGFRHADELDAAKNLSDKAKEILLSATTKESEGLVYYTRNDAGDIIWTLEKRFNENVEQREAAAWKDSFEELKSQQLILQRNGNDHPYEVTTKGYEVSDELRKNTFSI